MEDPEEKVMQNYHQVSLKLLANIFTTASGRAWISDSERTEALIDFCNQSFKSCNTKVVIHAALVLFNYLLAFDSTNKKDLQPVLEKSIEAITVFLANESIADAPTLTAVLICVCRLLYKNHGLT